jgi:hypothetical protein
VDEIAEMQVVPMCPQCGRLLVVIRKQTYPGELVPVTCHPGCDWTGVTPIQVPIVLYRKQRVQ